MRKKAGPGESPGCHLHNSVTLNSPGWEHPDIHGRGGEKQSPDSGESQTLGGREALRPPCAEHETQAIVLKEASPRQEDRAGLSPMHEGASVKDSDRR